MHLTFPLHLLALNTFMGLNCCRVAISQDCFNFSPAIEAGELQADGEWNESHTEKEHWLLFKGLI